MTAFLATLSAAAAGNWAICKRHGLWGAGSGSHAKHGMRLVQPGDVIYVWQSKAGLLAKARATGPGQEVAGREAAPWPEPERYRFTLGIEVVSELAQPAADRFEDRRSVRFGVREPFVSIRDRVRFVTAGQLEAEIRQRFAGGR